MDRKATITLEVVVKGLSQLHDILKTIEKIDGVIEAERSRL